MIAATNMHLPAVLDRILVVSETITITTNVTTTSNESGCKTCTPGTIPAVYITDHNWGGCKPYVPATEKTETTQVIETSALRFVWKGMERGVTNTRVIEEKVRKWKAETNWKEEK
jgi:hypothetical protein